MAVIEAFRGEFPTGMPGKCDSNKPQPRKESNRGCSRSSVEKQENIPNNHEIFFIGPQATQDPMKYVLFVGVSEPSEGSWRSPGRTAQGGSDPWRVPCTFRRPAG